MFERIQPIHDDSILGLIEKFKNDSNPAKVDLGVGVYRDSNGATPILRSVKLAEEYLTQTETTKTYTDSHGDAVFGHIVSNMVLGAASIAVAAGRVSATQTPGGTAAIRLAADLIALEFPERTVWLPDPTWPNHHDLFSGARSKLARYSYLGANNRIDFAAMLSALRQIPEGDAVLLHACCHNPSGHDLSAEQWHEVLQVLQQRRLLPVVDFAYQGLGDGLDEDAYGVRLLANELDEMLVTYSCCKNFGIYVERTGCLLVLARNSDVLSHVRARVAAIARSVYSSPPGHGSSIVRTIHESDELRHIWREEVDAMRNRVKAMRVRLVEGLRPYGLADEFAHILDQKGLFSFTGLTAEQVEFMRRERSVYLVSSGRANIAGLTEHNVGYVCESISQAVAVNA